jgi:hypothetical protein
MKPSYVNQFNLNQFFLNSTQTNFKEIQYNLLMASDSFIKKTVINL